MRKEVILRVQINTKLWVKLLLIDEQSLVSVY